MSGEKSLEREKQIATLLEDKKSVERRGEKKSQEDNEEEKEEDEKGIAQARWKRRRRRARPHGLTQLRALSFGWFSKIKDNKRGGFPYC